MRTTIAKRLLNPVVLLRNCETDCESLQKGNGSSISEQKLLGDLSLLSVLPAANLFENSLLIQRASHHEPVAVSRGLAHAHQRACNPQRRSVPGSSWMGILGDVEWEGVFI